MDAFTINDQDIRPPDTSAEHFIVAQVGSRRLAFAEADIAGLLLLERSQVLALPFYHPAVLGVVHDQGQLVPLIGLLSLLEGTAGQLREVFNAVQLNGRTGLAGAGLVIEHMLGNFSAEQIAADPTIEHFQPQLLGVDLCAPLRWGRLAT